MEISTEQLFEMLEKTHTKTNSGLRKIKIAGGDFIEQNPHKRSVFADLIRKHPDLTLAWHIPTNGRAWTMFAKYQNRTASTDSSNLQTRIRVIRTLLESKKDPIFCSICNDEITSAKNGFTTQVVEQCTVPVCHDCASK